MESIPQSPGTVSRILWHFTGGPLWNDGERRQKSSPKPSFQAFANLKSILKSCVLRLGDYKEVIKVRIPERRTYNHITRKTEVHYNVVEELTSSPVCCLADVPIIHLAYLAPRYGEFAIGFHRDSVVLHGFNPVFYALDDAKSVFSIYKGLGQLRGISGEIFKVCCQAFQESAEEFIAANSLKEGPDQTFIEIISEQAGELDKSVRETLDSFENF